jgi:hypothetical protein
MSSASRLGSHRERKRGRSSFRAGGRRGVSVRLADGDQSGGADGLQGRNRLGDEGGLLFDDGVIDGSAEAFVEDFYAEQFGRGGGAVFVGGGDGDIEGQDLISEPRLLCFGRAARHPLDNR